MGNLKSASQPKRVPLERRREEVAMGVFHYESGLNVHLLDFPAR
jgi:hypothetical protein